MIKEPTENKNTEAFEDNDLLIPCKSSNRVVNIKYKPCFSDSGGCVQETIDLSDNKINSMANHAEPTTDDRYFDSEDQTISLEEKLKQEQYLNQVERHQNKLRNACPGFDVVDRYHLMALDYNARKAGIKINGEVPSVGKIIMDLHSLSCTPGYTLLIRALKNHEESKMATHYQEAAEQGDFKAMNALGDCYFYGEGVEEDQEQAVSWYQKAAEKGHAKAMFNLGSCYYKGRGVKQDFEQAVSWYQKAAEKGDADAMLMLVLSYCKGEGVKQDFKQAVFWARKAEEQGNEQQKKQAKELLKMFRDAGIDV